ncbi:uncharacterized protein LOC143551977 [Bidens hawaiensis]|uniref:uncharacterized protein LOC143551977 n=1 Tax=Bidens hawaiensis TaxID=980011 RepID=UPI00404A87EA
MAADVEAPTSVGFNVPSDDAMAGGVRRRNCKCKKFAARGSLEVRLRKAWKELVKRAEPVPFDYAAISCLDIKTNYCYVSGLGFSVRRAKVDESQFNQMLNIELEQVMVACKSTHTQYYYHQINHRPTTTTMVNLSSVSKKITKGRKKIEIKKIEEANSRQVTFSKRRTGLFKKAAELCILTGAQVAILVTSPGGRVFAFAHPKVEAVVDRYLQNNTTAHYSPPPLPPAQEFNEHYTEVSRELEAEKKRRELIPSTSGLPWFEGPTEGMDQGELELFLWSLVELRRKVLTRADELMMINRPQSSSVFDQMPAHNVPAGFMFQHHAGGSGEILPKF